MFDLIAGYLKMAKPEYFDEACVLFYVPEELSKLVCQVANSIDKDLINFDGGGIEDQAHVTVLYGVEDDLDIGKYFKQPINLRTDDKITYFDNDNFSVAKIDVFSDQLKQIHMDMKAKEPNKHKYDYHPHITIAYLNKGVRLPEQEFDSYSWVQTEMDLTRNGLLDRVEL